MKFSNITVRKEYFVKHLKFDYDKLNDLLYVYKVNSKVYTSVMIGEFHLEFDKEGNVVGLEILRASEILEEYSISKQLLENIDDLALKVVVRNNSLLVFMKIKALEQEKTTSITMNCLESQIMKAIV